MRIAAMITALLLLGVPAAQAQAEPKGAAEEIKELRTELTTIQRDLQTKFREAQSDEEKQKIRDEFMAIQAKFAAKFLAVAEKYPKEPEAFAALQMALNGDAEVGEKAADLLIKNHLDHAQITQLVATMSRANTPGAAKFLSGVIEKHSDEKVQGSAAYGLGVVYKNMSEKPGLKPGEEAKFVDEAVKAFGIVVDKFGDQTFSRGGTLGEAAKADLWAVKNLRVGKEHPEVEGEDTDGKTFKLSDYRGKVILLDFWGHW